MRIISPQNPGKGLLKDLFLKFFPSYSNIQKEHLFVEFLKVAQECALIGLFESQDEVAQITEFAYLKFQAEVD